MAVLFCFAMWEKLFALLCLGAFQIFAEVNLLVGGILGIIVDDCLVKFSLCFIILELTLHSSLFHEEIGSEMGIVVGD